MNPLKKVSKSNDLLLFEKKEKDLISKEVKNTCKSVEKAYHEKMKTQKHTTYMGGQ